jgi:DNA helicase-2/ATP-dependent DNA helicase PcrA
LYRLAWAELKEVPLNEVDAVFFDLGKGEVVSPPQLADREELEALVSQACRALAGR